MPEKPSVVVTRDTGRVVVTNGRLSLAIDTRPRLNARSLKDDRSGSDFADADYCWPEGSFPRVVDDPVVADLADGGRSVAITGRLGSLLVEQLLTAPAGEPGVLLERITITNPTDAPVVAAGFACGFAKRIRAAGAETPDATRFRFCPIPYRQETDGTSREFPLGEVAEHWMSYAGWAEKPVTTSAWGSEGWAWSDGTTSLLIAKYNEDSMEWSLLEPRANGGETVVRFGGAGQWKHGHPEASTLLPPGGRCGFGETRLQVLDGDWRKCFSAFRRYLDGKGCRPRTGYDPPVHWNELYDNEYYFRATKLDVKDPGYKSEEVRLLREHYTLAHMLGEAAKAKELGCQALYLDPGWDTGSSHHLWDESRLGTLASFLETMRRDYGLAVSLWIGTGGVPPTYADPEACPLDARVVDANGKRTDIHCVASPAYFRTKAERLHELCRHGVAFLMFDSTQYSGPCYDPGHGHAIPSTREEHARALLHLVQELKREHPRTLIEMHDFITGPGGTHYTPGYYGYAKPDSFDCLWGHEFMWNSWEDLVTRRALSLYYYNLACSIPIYLHVNLKQENGHALVFWWYASTCRHLGVGGKPAEPAWEACKRAMRQYLAHKRFYAQGVFHGIDETVHAHTLRDLGASVVNCFNLDAAPIRKQVRFAAADIGLPDGPLEVEGAPCERDGTGVAVDLDIPEHGHVLLKVRRTSAV